MAKKSVSELVEELCSPIVENLGYELVEVKYAKGRNGMELTLFIYSKQGITLEDCEKVSTAVDEPVDELNPTNDVAYILNVSSPGIDRPIKNQRDFEKNLGKEIEVTLFAKDKETGQKVFKGILQSFNETKFTIKNEKIEKTFDMFTVAHIVPVIKF